MGENENAAAMDNNKKKTIGTRRMKSVQRFLFLFLRRLPRGGEKKA
jgi:hypothetical protein